MAAAPKIVNNNKLFSALLLVFILSFSLLCLYYGTFVAPISDSSDHRHPFFSRFARPPFDRQDSAFDLLQFDSALPRLIPVCDKNFSELIPCLDRNLIYQLKLKPNLGLMEHYERHCPPQERRYNCLIPPPMGYKIPIRWPDSRDEVWKVNIPHTHLASEKSDQNWMVVNGDKINFPGGGTHFHDGADKYISALAKMLKIPDENLSNGGNIRNILDVGCGVASFGAYLLPLNIIAMSLAPNDVHENQIQFALERGIPSTLGVLGTKRLPYPSRSFELAHCSRCRIDWLQRDGILLLELDRLLRPGGYFVYSSPEVYAQDPENRRIWGALSDLLGRMCWRVVAKKDQTVIWAKPTSNGCYRRRAPGTRPFLCGADEDPDVAWNMYMKPCIIPYSKHKYLNTTKDCSYNVLFLLDVNWAEMHQAKGSRLTPWPQRLLTPPPRLQELGISAEEFQKDSDVWHLRVSQYWKQMKSVIVKSSFRNVLDMNSNLGGFAASLRENDVWVMNVVPSNSSKLKIIYDRGLIGALHDWCESFSTYPRTYDLLHAWRILSEIDARGCSIEDLLIEMDRLLRPLGFVILRDKQVVVDYVRKLLTALRWDAWLSEIKPSRDGLSSDEDTVLIARKRLWEDEA